MNYTDFNSGFLSAFDDILAGSQSIVITSHISPDEDSISSVLSLYDIVSTTYSGKKIRIVYTGEAVARFSSFKNFDKIEFVDDVANHVAVTDLLIVVDGGQLSRFSRLPEKLALVEKRICIDHHSSAPDVFSLSLIVSSATSTSEVLYRAFDAEKMLTKELAELFLLGIIGDTGMFAFVRPSQLEIFSISQNLLRVADTSIDIFLSRYRSISDREFAIIQNLMKNTRYGATPSWPDFQYSFIERDEIQKNNYTDEEISAGSAIYMGHYLRAVKGYSWGFVATPRKSGECRVSFRSLPKSVNVRDLAERMGIGGGHDRSAGSAIKKIDKDIEAEDAITTIIEWMKTNKPLLN